MVKIGCQKCGTGWERDPTAPREPCPGCGTSEWDTEYALENFLGARSEYFVVGERLSPGHLMTLELRGTWNRDASAMAPLCYRLKVDYRHRKGDLAAKDGRELVITFDRAGGAPTGRWEIANLRRRTPNEERREITDACRRHRWAIRVVRESYNINAPADQAHCTCPSEPSCEVCVVAAKFAEDRRTLSHGGARYWTDLEHAVKRDLGLMA